MLPGDVVAFYTDGIIEADRRPVDGEARFLDALSTYRFDGLDALLDRLVINGQPDDGTLVLMAIETAQLGRAGLVDEYAPGTAFADALPKSASGTTGG